MNNDIELALTKARQAIALMQSIDTVPEAEMLIRDVVDLLDVLVQQGTEA